MPGGACEMLVTPKKQERGAGVGARFVSIESRRATAPARRKRTPRSRSAVPPLGNERGSSADEGTELRRIGKAGVSPNRRLNPLLASSEARRVVGRRLPSLTGLTSLLFRVRGYAQPIGAGPIRGPALIPREVCWPRTPAPCSSPPTGRRPIESAHLLGDETRAVGEVRRAARCNDTTTASSRGYEDASAARAVDAEASRDLGVNVEFGEGQAPRSAGRPLALP
jgi:hypothetical protein